MHKVDRSCLVAHPLRTIKFNSKKKKKGARPPASGHPSMPPPCSGGPVDSARTGTGVATSCTKGGKAKGKGKGESFAEVASNATSKPVGVELPHKQTKITDTFKPV